MKIHFLGAAGTVTGSKYLIETEGKNILVDCGLFQGLKELRSLNWQSIPFNVKKIDMVLLTHGGLKDKISEAYGWSAAIPKLNQISLIED